MIRYAVRGLRTQWTSWLGTLVVLGLSCALVHVCLAHRMAVTRPDVVAEARRLGISRGELELSGLAVYVYSALVGIGVLGALGPAHSASRVLPVAVLRDADAPPRTHPTRTRGLDIIGGLALCVMQAWVVTVACPITHRSGLPAGGGQAMILALLLGVLVVIAAPAVVPPTLRLWTLPIARIGAVWRIARRLRRDRDHRHDLTCPRT